MTSYFLPNSFALRSNVSFQPLGFTCTSAAFLGLSKFFSSLPFVLVAP
jgi:hypothetical protein